MTETFSQCLTHTNPLTPSLLTNCQSNHLCCSLFLSSNSYSSFNSFCHPSIPNSLLLVSLLHSNPLCSQVLSTYPHPSPPPNTPPSPLCLSSPPRNPFSTSLNSSQPLSSLSWAISSAWLVIPPAETPLTSVCSREGAGTPFKKQNILCRPATHTDTSCKTLVSHTTAAAAAVCPFFCLCLRSFSVHQHGYKKKNKIKYQHFCIKHTRIQHLNSVPRVDTAMKRFYA